MRGRRAAGSFIQQNAGLLSIIPFPVGSGREAMISHRWVYCQVNLHWLTVV